MVSRSLTKPQVRVVQAHDVATVRRVQRRPRHNFNVKAKPYEIVPFVIAPVLPGETLESLLMQSRVVTDPIQNPLIGWWKEYYFFYISHRGLAAWDTSGVLQSMMLDTAQSTTSLQAAANSVPYYTFKGGMDFVLKATEACVSEYFRDEDEAVNVASIENYYAAKIDTDFWFQNLKEESAGTDDAELPGVDGLEEEDIFPGLTTEYAQWELMRDANMTDLTYEDYLKSYGVNIPKSEDQGGSPDEKFRPELIRFSRSWQYPSNTVNPADGVPASAVSWSIAERADKKRFFKEPGFVIGLTVTRPKLYLGNQKGSAVGMLNHAYRWLPAVLSGHPYSSMAETLDTTTDGILQNQDEDYWIDMKDLFLLGDQFVNHAMSAAANHGIALPVTNTLQYKYPTDALVESLFKTAGSEYVREDGVVHFNILSRLRQTTP